MVIHPRSIHQVIDLASSGDSITNDALGIQAQLRGSRSLTSEIWALSAPGGAIGVSMRVSPLLPPGSADDALIVHVRDPDSPIWPAIANRPERIVMRPHGWQLPSTRPLKTVTIREAPNGAGSTLDVLQRFNDVAAAHRVRPVAVMAVSPSTAELTGPQNPETTTRVVAPFFPYDEFATIGQRRARHGDPSAVTTTHGGAENKTPHRTRSPRPDELAGPRILCVGRLEPHAEVEKLLTAMHLAATNGLDAALLIVVGRSSIPAYEVALRELARDLRINVFFGGHCSQPDLLGLMATATMLVSPSRASGFGVRFVEAMAAGVPVVGYSAGALPDTVTDAGLLLAPVDDAEVLAEAIVALSRDLGLQRDLIDKGLARSPELAPARSAGLLQQFFDDVFGPVP